MNTIKQFRPILLILNPMTVPSSGGLFFKKVHLYIPSESNGTLKETFLSNSPPHQTSK